MYTAPEFRLMQALNPLLAGTSAWDNRWAIVHYVSRCEAAGFCVTDDQRRQCANRYMAGKRAITPPGTKRKKRAAKAMSKALAAVPPLLAQAISHVVESPAAAQFAAGNEKALNQLVGAVLKAQRAEPALVRALLVKRIRPHEQPQH